MQARRPIIIGCLACVGTGVFVASSALAFTTATGERTFYAFLYATQSPLFAAFVPLKLRPRRSQCGLEVDEDLAEHFDWEFTIDFSTTKYSDQFPYDGTVAVHVLPSLLILEGSRAVTHSELLALDDFLPRDASKKAAKRCHKQDRKVALAEDPLAKEGSVLSAHPWLEQFLLSASGGKAKGQQKRNTQWEPDEAPGNLLPLKSGGDTSEEEDDSGASSDEHNDEKCEEVFAILRAKRAEWASCAVARGHSASFTTSILGGAWLQRNKNKAYDAFKGQAVTG